MKSTFHKAGIGVPLIAVALLGVTGCSRSADSTSKTANIQLIADTTPEAVWGAQKNQGMIAHPFVYKADKKLKSVGLVGSFNNWDSRRSCKWREKARV